MRFPFVLILLGGAFLARSLPSSGALEVVFFDVGQGDSALVRFPDRSHWLIDGGGGFEGWDVGQDLVLELARAGALRLQALVISHPDLDHVLGLRSVIAAVPVGEVYLNQYFLRSPTTLLTWILGKIRQRAGQVRAVEGRLSQNIAGVQATFLPVKTSVAKANDHSLCVLLEYRGCRFLFTGDIEQAGEADIVRRGRGPVTVLKVPHHGSRTSSSEALLEAWPPQIAVVSAGYQNSYGHPHASVLARYRRRKIPVLRTDFHGFVRFEVDQQGQISCLNALGSCGVWRCQAPVTNLAP